MGLDFSSPGLVTPHHSETSWEERGPQSQRPLIRILIPLDSSGTSGKFPNLSEFRGRFL